MNKKRHQWQTVEPQQKHKHKIQLVAGQYLQWYVSVFIKLTLGSYTEPVGHLVHYSHLIWSHIKEQKEYSFHLKTSFFYMESSKANTMGIVKILLPCVYTIRKTLQLITPENTITYHNALCLSPQNFA